MRLCARLLILTAVIMLTAGLAFAGISLEYIGQVTGTAYQITASGNYIFGTAQAGMPIFDLTNPANPVNVLTFDTPGTASALAVQGNYAYIADYTNGLQLIDISNPAAPVLGARVSVNYAGLVVASGGYAYVRDYNYSIHPINVANPATPYEVATFYAGTDWNAMAVSGSCLYLAGGGGLKVIDISNQRLPTQVGAVSGTGSIVSIATAGHRAYVTDGSAGLRVFNVSDSAHPSLAATCSTGLYMNDVSLCGSFAFTANWSSGLSVIGISSPASPSLILTVPGNSLIYSRLAVHNNYVYVIVNSGGLAVYRINHTAWGSISGSVRDSLGAPVSGAIVSTDTGGYTATTDSAGAYSMPSVLPGPYVITVSKAGWSSISTSMSVADGQSIGLDLVLQHYGTIAGHVRDNHANPVSGVLVADGANESTTDADGAYTLNNCSPGLHALWAIKSGWANLAVTNVSVSADQTTTREITFQNGTVRGTVKSNSGSPINGATVAVPSTGASTTTNSSGFYSLADIPPGSTNIVVSRFGYTTITSAIGVTGNTATTQDFTLQPFATLHGFIRDKIGRPISGATVTTVSGNYYTTTTSASGEYTLASVALATYVLSITKTSYATTTRNITAATPGEVINNDFALTEAVNADLISRTTLPSYYAYGVTIAGSMAYVAAGPAGVTLVDVTNAAVPVVKGICALAGTSYDIAISGHYAYVAADTAGLHIVDVADPLHPARIGTYDTTGNARGVVVSGNYAYVADGASGLQIISISNPANPIRVGGYDTPDNAYAVSLYGSCAYVADGQNSGVQVINVSSPASPTRSGGCSISDPRDVVVSGSYAYVGDASSGLQITNAVCGNPNIISTTPTCGATHIAVSGNSAALTSSVGNVSLFDVSDPAVPACVGPMGSLGYTTDLAMVNDTLYSITIPGALSIYAIGNPSITSASPSVAENGAATAMSIAGSVFRAGAIVKLTHDGCADIHASSINVTDPRNITCTVDLTGAAPGYWNVVVTNPDGKSRIRQNGLFVLLSSSYPCYGTLNRSLTTPLISAVCSNCRFAIWGKIYSISSSYLYISDGSVGTTKTKVWVTDGTSTFTTNDYIIACGTVYSSSGEVILACKKADVKKYN